MEFAVIPSYKDIFKEEPPELVALINDIPSKWVISLFAGINSNLFLEPPGTETQIKIFQFIIRRFTPEQKDIIYKGLYPFIVKGNGKVTVFALWYSMEFIAHELLNYREFDIEDTTPDQEFRIFQAYLIIVERLNYKHLKLFSAIEPLPQSEKDFPFEWNTWGMLANQFDFNSKTDPLYQAIRSFLTLDFLNRQEQTKLFVDNFLTLVQRKSLWHYVFDFLQLVKIGFTEEYDNLFKKFIIVSSQDFDSILDLLCINVDEFRIDESKHADYKGIREKPLFKLQKNQYVVLNWAFFYNQIYRGLLFDFYARSGTKTLFKIFPDFYSYISTNVSEKILFTPILDTCLRKKYSILHFDDGADEGIPDCYFRMGKYIFIFEFKDVLMPIRVIESSDYKTIKEDISNKFIANQKGKSKGIRQLLSHVSRINEGYFDFDNFEQAGIKRRNIVIYPFIVYTDFRYSLPGINHYLGKTFSNEMAEYGNATKINLQQIKPLTMVDFELFFDNFPLFQDGKLDLKNLVEDYHRELETRRKKVSKEPSTQNFVRMFPGFEEIFFQLTKGVEAKREKSYIQKLFDRLKLNPVIPD